MPPTVLVRTTHALAASNSSACGKAPAHARWPSELAAAGGAQRRARAAKEQRRSAMACELTL
jgi:hypothetical protein